MSLPTQRMPGSPASHSPRIVLTIAGFDPGSGAGVSADLQVFAAHGLYGTAAITALTVQSTLGVFRSEAVDAKLLGETLWRLQEDLPPAAIKIGMLADESNVAVVSSYLRSLTHRPLVVVDPVILASSGAELLSSGGVERLLRELLPLTDWLTPNRAELHRLIESDANNAVAGADDPLEMLGCAYPRLHIVQTGGDDPQPTDTLRLPSGEKVQFAGLHIDTTSTHGTGCVFSSALTAALVQGRTPVEAVQAAKGFVREALLHAPGVGDGRGPLRLSPHLNFAAGS